MNKVDIYKTTVLGQRVYYFLILLFRLLLNQLFEFRKKMIIRKHKSHCGKNMGKFLKYFELIPAIYLRKEMHIPFPHYIGIYVHKS